MIISIGSVVFISWVYPLGEGPSQLDSQTCDLVSNLLGLLGGGVGVVDVMGLYRHHACMAHEAVVFEGPETTLPTFWAFTLLDILGWHHAYSTTSS